MNVFGDSSPLAFDSPLSFQALESLTHPPPGDDQHQTRDSGGTGRRAADAEPPRLPKVRQNGQGYRSALLVPNAVVVASGHSEGVITRRNIPVIDAALGSGVNPSRFEVLEPVAEPHFFGDREAQAGIMKLESLPAGRDSQIRGHGRIFKNRFAIGDHV